MKDFLRALLILLVMGALGAGGFLLYQTRFAQPASADNEFTVLMPVQRGNISEDISVVGEVYAVQQEDLRFDLMTGRTPLLTLDVDPGNLVEEGDVLATIDPTPYQQAFDQALSELQEAEEALADLQTPATELEIAQAELAVAKAELDVRQAEEDLGDLQNPDITDLQSKVADARAALTEAQADLAYLEVDSSAADRLDRLRETESEKAGEYDRLAAETYQDDASRDRLRVAYNAMMDARDAVVTAETQAEINLLNTRNRVLQMEDRLLQAEEALSEAEAGPDELALAQAQLKPAEAEVALADAQEKRADLDTGADATDFATAQTKVDRMRLDAADAKDALEAATLRAPFSGTVLDTSVNPGDLISADMPILTLANLDELEVLASVDETTIRQVQAGQQAIIAFDAFPNQQLEGQVLSVPLQGSLQGDVMIYQVSVSFENTAELPLLVGMTANVNITVGQAQDVLLVPAMAVQMGSGFYQVLVADQRNLEASPQAVPVEIGLSDGVSTEIVRGLNPNDLVVVQLQSAQTSGFSGFGGLGGFSGGQKIGR